MMDDYNNDINIFDFSVLQEEQLTIGCYKNDHQLLQNEVNDQREEQIVNDGQNGPLILAKMDGSTELYNGIQCHANESGQYEINDS